MNKTGWWMILVLSGCVASRIDVPQNRVLLTEPNVENAYPRLSKHNKRILYQSNRTGKWQLFVFDIASSASTQVTKDTFNNNFPDWSFDNKRIAFVSDRDGNEEIYVMNTDGSGLQRITNDSARDIHPYFSPDGKYLLFNSTRGNSSLDIYRYEFATGDIMRLTDTYMDETCARYAPDMKRIVFLRNGAMMDDVFVLNTATGLSNNVTNTPKIMDGWPMFSYQGNWIFYSSMESGTYCIYRVKPDGTGKQQLTNAATGEEDARVFVANDGKSFIYNKRKNGLTEIRQAVIQP